MTRSFRLALLSALATFALIVLGGLSRTRTGPGCDDFGRACAATEDLVVIDEFFPLPVDAGAQV